ncbi:MAG: Na/Pi cotransporter family protein [Acidobacteria bacterium]|nr:MAG: Na/Pi cotransporter family protein [Acidobacteriota bacterium]
MMDTLPPENRATWVGSVGQAATLLVLLFVFLMGVQGLGDGFRLLGRDLLDAFFIATENPFISLMVGILATTLVQSSSVTTVMVVGLVAAPENPLPVANAVPMIMGANIGTTVTNTVVSLAHMGRRDEFFRAFSVATCHDFFNFMTVAVLLPLEITTGYLRRAAVALASTFGGVSGVTYENPLKNALKAGLEPLKSLAGALFEAEQAQGILLVLISGLLIFGALLFLVRVMRAATQSSIEVFITRFLGRSALVSILLGAVLTVMVQSSSITTSLLVPLAGAGLLTLEQAFPVTIGANVGTTVTALLATLAVSGANAHAGVEIALVHLLFNLSGIALIYPVPFIRRLPLVAARSLARAAVESRKWALLYVLGLFYGLPAILVVLNKFFE